MTADATSQKRTESLLPGPRSFARLAAVQALYQMDLAGTDASDVINEFLKGRLAGDDRLLEAEGGEALKGADTNFFSEIVRGVVLRQREIDCLVDQQLAAGWRLFRVDSILRAILRAGAFELLARADVPARVVINEYINVGHAFFAQEEPRVINGVLHELAKRLRPAELKPEE